MNLEMSVRVAVLNMVLDMVRLGQAIKENLA